MQLKNNENSISIGQAEISTAVQLQLFSEGISAGFPSPAQDFLDAY